MARIQDRAVDRHYIALVHGIMAHDTGMIDAPIARSADERCRMAVRDTPRSRPGGHHHLPRARAL